MLNIILVVDIISWVNKTIINTMYTTYYWWSLRPMCYGTILEYLLYGIAMLTKISQGALSKASTNLKLI